MFVFATEPNPEYDARALTVPVVSDKLGDGSARERPGIETVDVPALLVHRETNRRVRTINSDERKISVA